METTTLVIEGLGIRVGPGYSGLWLAGNEGMEKEMESKLLGISGLLQGSIPELLADQRPVLGRNAKQNGNYHIVWG